MKKYTIYVGGEDTIKGIAAKGCIRVLNPKTMRWQNYGMDATFEAVKDPDSETGWMLLSDRDVRAEARDKGFTV